MADYQLQQQEEYAKALRELENAKRKAEITEGRYDRSKENKAGAGRGVQGGPTAKELEDYRAGGQTVKLRKGGIAKATSKQTSTFKKRANKNTKQILNW